MSDYEAAKTALAHHKATTPKGSQFHHVKSGHTYEVIGHGMIEATMTPAFIYRRTEEVDAVEWIRACDIFLDGRFLRLN